MAVALVDSVVLIDYKDTGAGDRHDGAEAIVEGIDAGDLPIGQVTNEVLLETLNWIHERQRHDIAVDLHHRLVTSAGFELIHSPQKDFRRAVELFKMYSGLAFGDATIAAHAEREDIDYLYSFDNDFDAIDDLTRLDTSSNPFT
jgi:predicted nucleic acid-binding protein